MDDTGARTTLQLSSSTRKRAIDYLYDKNLAHTEAAIVIYNNEKDKI